MARCRFAIILTILIAAASWAVSSQDSRDGRAALAKLDEALVKAVRSGEPHNVRVLLRVVSSEAGRIRTRLAGTATTSRWIAPDLATAEMSLAALETLVADDAVIRASSDAEVRTLATSATSLSSNVLLATEGLLTTPYTGRGIGVAVVDSGFVPSADLTNVTASYDFTTGATVKAGPKDDFGHGTHVSGLIGSQGATTYGQYRGVAPGVRFIVLRALASNGSGYTSNVIAAINFATANKKALGIDVLNLSLGHPIYEPAAADPLVQAVENAVSAGIVVVAAAGNFGGDPVTHEVGYAGITSPGNAPGAITVGALDTHGTAARWDDSVAWYSSRGPTWYDGYQKPDIVAPGSRLPSDVKAGSVLGQEYPGGLIKTSGTCNLMALSGTSMSSGVVSGVVAVMLEASRTKHPGLPLTPNAVKAILQYTAFDTQDDDPLTSGAGSLNAAGAVALAAAIDPNQPVGSWWLSSYVSPWTSIGGQTLPWGQRLVWGDRIIWGNQIYTNDPAFALRVIWGNRLIWGNRVVWGSSTVWDSSSQSIWGTRIIWGSSLLGMTDGERVIWGNNVPWGAVTQGSAVWGSLRSSSIAPTSIAWGNLERANGDIK